MITFSMNKLLFAHLKALRPGARSKIAHAALDSWLYIGFGLIIVVALSAVIPYNMDEFVQYTQLRCWFYRNSIIDPACTRYDLNFLNTGLLLPLRSYDYIGSFPSLYYLPLFLVWRSPLSARFLGYLFLVVQAVILSKLFGLPKKTTLAGLLLFFPYFVLHMTDMGPVAFQTTSLLLTYLFFDRWLSTGRWRYPILCSIMFFCGFWTKLSYVWLFPGIAAMLCMKAWEYRDGIARNRKLFALQAGAMVYITATLIGSLLLSTLPGNAAFKPFLYLLGLGETYSLSELFTNLPYLQVTQRLMNPLQATHRSFVVANPAHFLLRIYGYMIYIVIPALLLALPSFQAARKSNWKAVCLYGIFLATFLIIADTKNAWAMHHAILAVPFLLLSAGEAVKAAKGMEWKMNRQVHTYALPALAGAFVLLNIYPFSVFPFQTREHYDDASKIALQRILNEKEIEKEYVVVNVHWGTHFYYGLFGPTEQAMVPGDVDQQKLLQFKEQTGRKVAYVYNRKELEYFAYQPQFPVRRCEMVDPNAVWQLALEDVPGEKNICTAASDYLARK